MMLKTEEITEIILKCKKGDSTAFTQIFSSYGKTLYGIALRYSKDTSEAEDIVQEAFIKIFEKISTFENKGSFEGWLKRILINTALNKCAKNKSLKEDYEIENIKLDYAETISSELTTNELLTVINQLPDGYKSVFNLYAIEGYSHKEIGELMSISEGTSKSQYSKAKVLLKKYFVHYDILNYEK